METGFKALKNEMHDFKDAVIEIYSMFRPYIKWVLAGLLIYMILNPKDVERITLKVKDFIMKVFRMFVEWFNKIITQIRGIGSAPLNPESSFSGNQVTTFNTPVKDEEHDLFEFKPGI